MVGNEVAGLDIDPASYPPFYLHQQEAVQIGPVPSRVIQGPTPMELDASVAPIHDAVGRDTSNEILCR